MDDSRIKTAREVLSAFFDEEKLRRGGRYAEFFASWKFLVGEQLAAHSHIADINNGVLLIEAEHPGWIQLLQLRQTAILDGIATRFPEFNLRSIAFKLGMPRPSPGSGNSAHSAQKPGSQEIAISASNADVADSDVGGSATAEKRNLDDIADPALKALLVSLKDTLQSGK
ncbi:MAG TPA: DUF721 domain-containing protein [Rectinemataceae bacterium]|nr:DUF721 domain-containing protein [Rectinemataceae bacterium]